MAEESNKELEDWVNMFCDFDSFCDEETKRLEESGLMYGIIYDNDFLIMPLIIPEPLLS
ncbi:MAG: hypothetical protein SPJ25_00825 [Prevotella sp.]|nr:hypothetical protein [Prevotella sp.]